MASNPMFLGLLCEHMRSGYGFPENTHSVFETYVSSRLNRDEERLYKRFQLEPDELRTTAEAVAFCMAADPGLGLSPTRKDIVASAQKLQIRLDDRFDRILDAITYLKLARTDTSTTTDKSNQFTFAHRRFQEYFSTAVVLREPHRVTPSQLLLDARWRETAVVLFQTQHANALSPLVGETSLLIKGFVEEIDRVTREQNVSYTPNEEAGGLEKPRSSMRFQWPLNALHVMRLLQEGVARRLDVLPREIRADVGFILTTASKLGITPDKKWALDVSGIAEASVLTELLRKAFSNPSQVLKDSAYKQVAKLSAIPVDLSYSIRSTLSRMALTGRLEKEKTATHAHLSRLNNAEDYLAALQLLIWLPRIDFALHAFVSVVILAHFLPHLSLPLTGTMGGLATTSIFIAAVGVPVSWYVFYRFIPRLTYTKFDPNSEIVSFNERERIASILPFMQMRTVVAILVLSIGGTIYGAKKIFNPGSFYVLEQFWYPVWLYVTFWAPAALLFAISGRFLHPLLWWLLPFLSLGKIAKGLVMVIVLISRDTKGFLKVALLLILLYVAFLAVIFGGVCFIPYFALIFTFTLSIAGLLTLSWWLYEKAHDILQWHQWNASKPTGINADDFIKTVRSYKTNKYRRRLTNAVRTKGLLIVSSDTEDLIYNFARELETRSSATSKRVGSVQKVIRYLGLGNEKADKPKEKPEEPSERNYIYGVAVSDEVVRLLEQVRVTR